MTLHRYDSRFVVYGCKGGGKPPHSPLAKKVFGCGADDAGRALVRWAVAIAADHDGGNAFRLAHYPARSRGQFISNPQNPCLPPFRMAGPPPPPHRAPRAP